MGPSGSVMNNIYIWLYNCSDVACLLTNVLWFMLVVVCYGSLFTCSWRVASGTNCLTCVSNGCKEQRSVCPFYIDCVVCVLE